MTVVAIVVAHVRSTRVEVEVARAVAIVASGRPIVAAALHAGHIRAAAVARCGEEDRT